MINWKLAEKRIPYNALLRLCGFLIILKMNPYFCMETFRGGLFSFIPFIAMIVIICIIIFFLIYQKVDMSKALIPSALLILLYLFNNLVPSSTITVQQLGNYILICLLLFLPRKDLKIIWNSFAWVFAITLIPGMIVMILLSLGIRVPSTILIPESATTASWAYFNKYFLAINLSSYNTGTQNVLQGVFDERGVVGTFSALLLCGDRFKIRGKLRNFIILIGGILSFSLAFFIMSAFYFFLSALKYRNWKTIAVIFTLILVYYFFISLNFSNYYLSTLQSRVIIQNGTLLGDNRMTENFAQEFNEYMNGDIVKKIFGYGSGTASSNVNISGSSSFKTLIIDFGYFGFSMMIAWIVMTPLVFFGFKWECVILLIIFVLSMYQRPNVFSIAYFTALFGGCSNILIHSEKTKTLFPKLVFLNY